MASENKACICYRLWLTGKLKVVTPLLIGSGSTGETATDIYVLKDKTEQPFIPGTSLAGVLRHIVATWNPAAANLLFGHLENAQEAGLQSAICIDDVLLPEAEITVRDGVSIDPATQIAKAGAKYDYEVVERGASGDFSLTVTLREKVVEDLPNWQELLQKLANQLAYGIRIGAMTSKGLGKVQLTEAKLRLYDFSHFADVQAWLSGKEPEKQEKVLPQVTFAPQNFVLDADFALKTSLLVRSRDVSSTDSENEIDVIPQTSKGEYLIPGTSVKGVLRHQAGYILQLLNLPLSLLDSLMGYANDNDETKKGQKSRFLTDEVYIQPQKVKSVKQTRNAIDRFTGATMDSRLFAEKALWQKDKQSPTVHLHLAIKDCQPWEAGLTLFLLKDLWTGKVALGGDKSIGRGYLQGLKAKIDFQAKTWQLGKNGQVETGEAAELETYAQALHQLSGKELA